MQNIAFCLAIILDVWLAEAFTLLFFFFFFFETYKTSVNVLELNVLKQLNISYSFDFWLWVLYSERFEALDVLRF